MLKFGGSSCLIGDPSWGGVIQRGRVLLLYVRAQVFFSLFRTENGKNGFSHCWIFFSGGLPLVKLLIVG